MCYMDRAHSAARYPERREHAPERALSQVGVRELRQNLSVYLRRVRAGETLEVTEHGVPVAQLAPLPPRRVSVLDRLVAEGRAEAGKGGNLADLGPPPEIGSGPTLSEVLLRMRDEDER